VARVAVVFPPLRVSRDFIDYPYFADLGAVQNAAVLRAAGHDVTLVDALALPESTLAPMEGSDVRLGSTPADVLARVPADCDRLVVAYTPFHRPPSRDPLLAEILAGLRTPGRSIVLADLYQSGQHVVDPGAAAVMDAYPEVDALLRWEAEATLAGMIAGPIASREVRIGEAPEKLDDLPLPAWDLVDVPSYFRFHQRVVAGLGRGGWAFPIDQPSLPLVSTRGCPFKCTHCSSNPDAREAERLVKPKTQRRHGAAWLARLFELQRSFGARRAHLLDELANVNEAHFDALLEELEKANLGFEIPNGLRADYVLPKHLEKMRGKLTTLSVSAESGVQRVADQLVGKRLDLQAIERVAKDASEAGIPTLVHFMIGLPGETKKEINGTLAFAMRMHDEFGAFASVQYATPLPGTELARLAKEKGKALPMAGSDWGPRFQHEPSFETADFTADELRRFKWTFDTRVAASSGPKKVILNVTYRCNNRCTFCATGTRTQLDGDLERQKELLVKYRKLGVRLLDLDGGEPTTSAGLFPLIAFARKIGYEKVNVTTNARMASYPAFAEKLAKSGVTSILVSIHGPDAKTHAQNVGVAEAFDQTTEGVRNLVKIAPKGVELGANITLTKSNHQKLPEVAQLIWDLGLPWLNVQFLTPFGRATSSVAPDTAEAAEVTMRVIDEWKGRMKINVINLPFCFMPGYEAHLMGDLLKLERHMLFVNVEEVNLFEYLRERRAKKPVCETCPHAVFCGGFYELEDVPEPTWLIKPEDLVRPVSESVPRPLPVE